MEYVAKDGGSLQDQATAAGIAIQLSGGSPEDSRLAALEALRLLGAR